MSPSQQALNDVAPDAYQFTHRLVDARLAPPIRPRAAVSVFDLNRYLRDEEDTRLKRQNSRAGLPVPPPAQKGVRAGSRPAAVLDLLAQHGSMDIHEIAGAFAINARHAAAITTDMKKRGLVAECGRINGRTRYALPESDQTRCAVLA